MLRDRVSKKFAHAQELPEFVRSMLTNHYKNNRLLVKYYLSAFIALSHMKNKFANDLRRILHRISSMQSDPLESTDQPISNCSDLLVHLVVKIFYIIK